MTAALGGGELATEWVTLLPETATLARKLREFRPRPIKVAVEADYDQMEREGERSGRRTGSRIDASIDRETKGTGRTAAHNVADGLNDRAVEAAAARLGANIRHTVEQETRKISFKHIGVGLFEGFKGAASGTMAIIRNVGTMATVIRYAARAARGLSISLLAGATAARLITGAGIARLGVALGFAAHQADRLAKQVARVTSALLVAAAAAKFIGFMHSASKVMGLVTLSLGALTGLLLAGVGVASQFGAALVTALTAIGSAAGIAAGAVAGLLGPALIVGKIAFTGMSDAAKEFNKQFKDSDEAFNKMIGERMGPLLTAVHDLKQGVTDAFTTAFQPAFGWLGGAIQNLMPRFKGLATTLGNLGGEIAGTLNFKAAEGQFDKLFDASDRFFQSFLGESGIAGVVGGLVDFATTAAQTFSGVGTNINDTLLKFGEFLSGVTGDQMKKVFSDIKQYFDNIWSVAGPLLNAIRGLGSTAQSQLAPGFRAFGDGIKAATPLLIQMSQVLMPALSKVMEALAPALPAIVKAFMPMAEILAVIAPPIARLVADLAPFAPVILAVTTAFKAAAIAMAIYNTAMLLFTNITKIARAAQWLFNAALAANPIGLVVVAIGAVVAALAIFFTKTETGRKLWDKIWTGIKETFTTVWEFLKTEGGKLWESIKPSLQSLWQTVQDVFGRLKDAFTELWPKIQPIAEALKNAWLAVEKFKWQVIITAIQTLAKVIGWWISNVVVPGVPLVINAFKSLWNVISTVFGAIKTAVEFTWNNVLSPIFTAIAAGWKILWFAIQVAWEIGKAVFEAVGDTAKWLYDNIFKPVFDGIVAVVQGAWSVMTTIFEAIKTGIDAIGTVAMWLWHNVFEPVWEAIKAGWDALWSYLGPIFDVFKSGIQGIGDVATKIADGIKSAWSGLKQVFLAPLHALGSFLAGVPTSVLGVEIPFVADIQKWGANLQGLAGGGIIKGPGTGTSDSIVGLDKSGVPTVRVSAGEGVVPKAVLDTPLGRYMFNALIGGLPAMATGGVVPGGRGDGLNPGAAWLSDYIKKNYGVTDIGGRRSEDGYGEHSSGNAIDIMVGSDTALGNQIAGFLKTNKDTLGLDGMIWQQRSYGYGGGWDGKFMSDRGSPTQNHMDHIHAILGKGRGASAPAVQLPKGPIVDPTGRSTSPGSASLMSSTTGGGYAQGSFVVDPKKVREAQDRVTDTENRLDIANQRLDEMKAKGTSSGSALNAQQDKIDKLTRDLQQAKDDLATAEQGTYKESKSSKSSSGSGSDDWSSVGGMIFDGFLESFGFDGSVFKNLFETPNVKSAMAGLNFGLGLLFPGDQEGGEGGGNPLGINLGGDGGGGLLGAGADMLAGIGDQAGVNMQPHGDMALAGATPGPGNGPTFDLRGSQLGVSPAAFEDKMGEMTAASKRHPTLGPG